VRRCYPRRTVRLIEIRLLDGPNVYRLGPAVKVEVAVGRRRTWYGRRDPERHQLVRLGAPTRARDWPAEVANLRDWIQALRAATGEPRGGLAVHRSSDPGHWIVTWPWDADERARAIADGAVALAAALGACAAGFAAPPARILRAWAACSSVNVLIWLLRSSLRS